MFILTAGDAVKTVWDRDTVCDPNHLPGNKIKLSWEPDNINAGGYFPDTFNPYFRLKLFV